MSWLARCPISKVSFKLKYVETETVLSSDILSLVLLQEKIASGHGQVTDGSARQRCSEIC